MKLAQSRHFASTTLYFEAICHNIYEPRYRVLTIFLIRRTSTLILAFRLFIALKLSFSLSLSVALVRTRTIPTERPPLVGEVSANFCG